MSGKLYIVGTPIGNLGDMTYRAAETLEKVDFICAEDTRVTLGLLNHFEIKNRLVSVHEHTSQKICEEIADRIAAGESCAVVSDAGMPCISDPGAQLIEACIKRGIEPEVVPGPTAVASAVALSDIPSRDFFPLRKNSVTNILNKFRTIRIHSFSMKLRTSCRRRSGICSNISETEGYRSAASLQSCMKKLFVQRFPRR